ncbi:MAG: FtsX-like permease family protein [Gemmatimonadales bacterium]|nr:FtsX-like permease family protein [Gemmatimonadales bacterium]NIN12953.1 FtsX-like permease family protein [Gemmatimonadales bacterium]NIR02628.1 FtsX-like permease family protein [Gemmatimonadales bacterium]NIS67204.1 FtsX-like permease family protein [Gemmatimonadales bacterium]
MTWLRHLGTIPPRAWHRLPTADGLVRDLRYALRTLRKSPGFTAVALISLAVGIGANTAIFSVVNAILFRDTPVRAPETLVNIYRDRAEGQFDALNYPDYREVRQRTSGVLSELEGYQYVLTQRDMGEEVNVLVGELVTGGYFRMLGVPAHVGRPLLPDDNVSPGAHPVVVLGFEYWRRAFGSDPGVVGASLHLAGRDYSVVGVAPPEFPGSVRGIQPTFFAPIMMLGELMPLAEDPVSSRGWNAFMPVGRMAPGATLAELRGLLAGVSEYLQESFPSVWQVGDSLIAVPAQEVVFNPGVDRLVRSVNFLAMGSVALVLLIACANVASLLLAKAADRRKEVALRLALGATRGRLVRQLLTETVLLGLLGGVAGLFLATWILGLGRSLTLSSLIPVGLDVGFDWTVLAFTLAASLATGVAVGFAPALQATQPDVAPTLKSEGARGGRPRTVSLSRALVAGQMAVSAILLVCAGLFIRSFDATKLVDPGFGYEPTAAVSFMVPSPRYSDAEGLELITSFLDRVRTVPGVTRAGAISNPHLNTLNRMIIDVTVEGVAPPPGRSAHSVDFTSVDSGFFAAAGIPLLDGRNFRGEDRADGTPVAIINQTMAQQFWPGESPLGRLIHLDTPGFDDPIVVGVARTAKIRNLEEDPRPFIYLPFAQEFNAWVTVLAQTRRDPAVTAREIHRLLRTTHPHVIVSNSTTLHDHIGIMHIARRLSALLAVVFAGSALFLAAVGLWGVVSFAVARRTREMGVRVALGAEPQAVVALMVKGGMRLVLLGGAVGLAGAILVTSGLSRFLFGVSPLDPLTFLAGILVLLVTGALAAYFPARRASHVDPVEALRAE